VPSRNHILNLVPPSDQPSALVLFAGDGSYDVVRNVLVDCALINLSSIRYTPFDVRSTTGELSQIPVTVCRVSPEATRRPAEEKQRCEGVFSDAYLEDCHLCG